MTSDTLQYVERVSSKRTEFLFIALTILSFLLFSWRITTAGMLDVLAGVFLFFSCFFLFYSLNYRVLVIRLTPEFVKLSFGIFTWKIPLNNISECRLDALPAVMRMGGAGIHFMLIGKRYRASFNFLEHSRVLIRLKRKAGWVRDVSFSTCNPEEVIRLLNEAISANQAA